MHNIRAEGRDVVLGPGEYFLQQTLLVHPLTAPIWIAGLAALFFSARLKPYRFLGWTYVDLLRGPVRLARKELLSRAGLSDAPRGRRRRDRISPRPSHRRVAQAGDRHRAARQRRAPRARHRPGFRARSLHCLHEGPALQTSGHGILSTSAPRSRSGTPISSAGTRSSPKPRKRGIRLAHSRARRLRHLRPGLRSGRRDSISSAAATACRRR